MTTRYDLCTGKTNDQGKTFWTKVGNMFPAREGDGFTIKLEAYPLPNEKGEVWVKAFVPREKDDTPRQQPRAPAKRAAPDSRRTAEQIDDDIPF